MNTTWMAVVGCSLAAAAASCNAEKTLSSLAAAGSGSAGGASAQSAGGLAGTSTLDLLPIGGERPSSGGSAPVSMLPPIVPNPDTFPEAPVVVTADGTPPLAVEAPGLLLAAPDGAAEAGCLIEPTTGTLVPRNWPRARARISGVSSTHNTFQFQLRAQGQTHVLNLFTSVPDLLLPPELWRSMIQGVVDQDIQVRVRSARVENGAIQAGPTAWASGSIRIAAVEAPGSIVYWYASQSDESRLKGFRIGDESVVEVLKYDQVKMELRGKGRCIGCHASTPDGEYIGLSAQSEAGYTIGLASGRSVSAGEAPPWLGVGAATVLRDGDMGAHAFSAGHWSPGDRLLLTRRPVAERIELVWVDLEATEAAGAFGVVARNGDPRGVFAPAWSRDGTLVVYTSSSASSVGHDANTSDLYRVPFNGRQGGTAEPIAGAATEQMLEYYPAIAPDGELVAYSRAEATPGDLYARRDAEVWAVPTNGGEAVRLAANDPVACLGEHSPGVTNSWPRWSPETPTAAGNRYYFLTFSSRRKPETVPQLFLAPVVRLADGSLRTFPAVRFWNQPDAESNHTPAWDTFKIPPVEKVPK